MTKYAEIYITEISKYFIVFFVALYVLFSFIALRREEDGETHSEYIWQNIMMFCTHFLCFLAICFETGEMEYLVFYAFQQILLFSMIALFRLLYPFANKLLLNNVCMLLSISFVILTRLSYDKALKQFFIIAVSTLICLAVPILVDKMKFLRDLTWLYAVLGIIALLVVLLLGAVTNGSKLSYSIGGITFQPSEFVKILFIFFLAAAFAEQNDFLRIVSTAIIAGVHILILVASKDLGSALIFFVVYLCAVFISTGRVRYLLLGLCSGAVAAVGAAKLFSHVQVRISAWSDPWSVIDSAGYQITQSLFAISSGGWFGLGLFQGTPNNIPYVEADFIFSAIVEEMGLCVGIGLLLICVNNFIIIMKMSMGIRNRFYQLLASGIAITYMFQVFLTVGGGTKFIPMTGVTLPFVSYGGSSVLTTLLLFFIAEGISIYKQDEEVEYEKRRQLLQIRRLRDRRRTGGSDSDSQGRDSQED